MQVVRRSVSLGRHTHRANRVSRTSAQKFAPSAPVPTHSHPRHFLTSPGTPKSPKHLLPSSTVSQIPQPLSPTLSTAVESASTKSLTIGLASGTLGAMCGIGGAIFAIPAMVRFKSLPQKVAAGNSLVAVTAVAIAGASSFYSADSVDLSIALPLTVTATMFTPVGARLASIVDASVLRKMLGAFMMILAPALPLRDSITHRNASPQSTKSHASDLTPLEHDGSDIRRTAGLSAAGATIGVTSGLLGISGGSLFTPLIATTCPDMPFRTVMGTTFAAMIIPTAAGALTYTRLGLITRQSLPALVVGAAVGAKLGSAVALALPDAILHYFFAGVLAVLGVRTFRGSISKRTVTSNVSR